MKRYEVMFLFDTAAAREWSAVQDEVKRLCSRIGADPLVCVKFDERKLAYEIKRRKRGTYALAYIDAPPERIGELERDVQLSEAILRALVLRADQVTEERIAQLRAHPAETPLAPLASETRRHDDERRTHTPRGSPTSPQLQMAGEEETGDEPLTVPGEPTADAVEPADPADATT